MPEARGLLSRFVLIIAVILLSLPLGATQRPGRSVG